MNDDIQISYKFDFVARSSVNGIEKDFFLYHDEILDDSVKNQIIIAINQAIQKELDKKNGGR
jgi:hypothetical protein